MLTKGLTPSTVFTKELSKRLGDAAIVADADPGFVASDIWRNNALMVLHIVMAMLPAS